MRRERHFIAAGKFFFVLSFVVLFGAIIIAFMNNFVPIPWNPLLLIGNALLIWIILMLLGAGMIWFDTSWMTPLHRVQQPSDPDRSTVVRVFICEATEKEYFVYGELDETVRKAVETDWPFEGKLRGTNWRVLDNRGNDVTDKMYLEVEGTLKVVFD